jgi:hypothetical protein
LTIASALRAASTRSHGTVDVRAYLQAEWHPERRDDG